MKVGETTGGMPIYHGEPKKRKKTKGDRNKRYSCSGCNQRTTKNQAKGSHGLCIYCRSSLIGWRPTTS